jgi:hypothetical protein
MAQLHRTLPNEGFRKTAMRLVFAIITELPFLFVLFVARVSDLRPLEEPVNFQKNENEIALAKS